ncbi:MAG: hypothetical protein IJX02_02500 [Clostridia bacterium]|nr:hypothetical protein [Clostridia bacterium]
MTVKKGFVFYYDWMKQLAKLDGESLKQVLSAMVDYHRDGINPPALEGLADMALGFIVSQMERMRENGELGRLGGRPKKNSTPRKEATPINNNVEDEAETDEEADAEEEMPIPFDEQVECDRRGREAYGDFKNVYLSEYEYQDLKIRFPLDYRKRINDLSYYINAKGNKYTSHLGAILNWSRNKNAEGESQTSTFDTDEFFQSAVERSKAKAAERRKNKTNEVN